MIRRKSRSSVGLKTKERTLQLIGGGANLCAERFGFTESGKGLVSSYTPEVYVPFLLVCNMTFAQYLPNLGHMIFMDDEGYWYRWHPTRFKVVTNRGKLLAAARTFVVPCYHNRYDAYAVFTGKMVSVIEGDGVTSSQLDTVFYCGAYHKGRAFVRSLDNPYQIHWSGNRVSDWRQEMTRSGYVRIDPEGGEVFNMLEFGDRLILVRRYGISEFVALGDPRHFRVDTNTKLRLPEVVPDTAVICGGKLWVYTLGGLYSFDGSSVTHVGLDFLGKDYVIKSALSYRGRYIYFNCTCGDEKQLLEYDTEEQTLTAFASEYDFVFGTDDGLYAFRKETGYRLVKGKDDDSRIWRSKPITLGTDGVKTLKSLRAEGSGNFRFYIDCDGRSRVVNGLGVLPVCERGREFTVTVKGTGTLKELTAQWEVNG